MFEGYAFEMLRTLLALAGVCVLAWAVLRMLAKRGIGQPFAGKGAMVQVLQRVPLDARRALYVVRAGERLLLVGVGESGAPTLVAEIDPALVDARAAANASDAPAASGGAVPRSVPG